MSEDYDDRDSTISDEMERDHYRAKITALKTMLAEQIAINSGQTRYCVGCEELARLKELVKEYRRLHVKSFHRDIWNFQDDNAWAKIVAELEELVK